MSTTTPPASPAEANRPPDHGTPGSLPWEAAARELARHALLPATEKAAPGFVHATAAETIRRACEQWARYACENWRRHDVQMHDVLYKCRSQCDSLGSQCDALRAQLALCRDVLEEARPMVKARLMNEEWGLDGRHSTVDDSILTRIEQALKGGL